MLGLRWGRGAALLALGALGCTDLSVVQTGTCGNGVVEPENGEDCDQKDATTSKNACGQPNKAGECRYICEHLGSIECPDGYRCGVDDVCRKPVDPMTWTQASAPIPEGQCEELHVFDFDSDGINDVVAVAPPTVTVHYFEKSRTSTPGDTLVVQRPQVSVGSLTPSDTTTGAATSVFTATPTLAVNLSRGLSLFSGQTDRTLAPSAYASVSIAKSNFRVAPFLYDDGIGPGVPLTGIFAYGSSGVSAMTPPDEPQVLAVFPPGDELAGDAVVARYRAGKCDQIALPLNDSKGGHVLVYSPCDDDGKPKLNVAPFADVRLPPTVKACVDTGVDGGMSMVARCRPLHVLDINHDGSPDLVITDDKYKLHLAFGSELGAFAPAGDAPADNTFSIAYPMPNVTDAPPIAVGDLNGDCALDVVDAQGIWLSFAPIGNDCAAKGVLPAAKYVDYAQSEDPHRWTAVQIADMNADGIPDVVVGSTASSGITLYAGTKASLFNPFRIVTSAPIKELSVGDFDGDTVNDIAFTEVGEADPETNLTYDTVLMSFGATTGAPTKPVAVADIEGVSQLLPTYEERVYPDLIRDLYVVALAGTGADQSTNLYVFPGDTGRQIVAPYFLVQPAAKSTIDVPTRSVIGSFRGDTSYRDIAVFARPIQASCPTPESCISRLWLLPTGADATIEPAISNASTAPKATGLDDPLSGATDALLANLGPVNGDGRDVLVLVGPGKDDATTIMTAAVTDGAFKVLTEPHTLDGIRITGGPGRVEAKMFTADVNGDGDLDVVLISAGDGIAVILWDGATSTLDTTSVKRVTPGDLNDLGCGAMGNTNMPTMRPSLAATVLYSPSGAPTLLAVRPDAAYEIAYQNGALVPSCRRDLAGGYAIVAADVDGDGIEDIVISERNGLDVYYGDSVPAGGSPAVEIVPVSGGAQ